MTSKNETNDILCEFVDELIEIALAFFLMLLCLVLGQALVTDPAVAYYEWLQSQDWKSIWVPACWFNSYYHTFKFQAEGTGVFMGISFYFALVYKIFGWKWICSRYLEPWA